MIEDAQVRVFDYSMAYSREEAARQDFADGLGDCDYILAQTALLSHTNERILRERFGQRVVTIANFYFRGLFPDSCYVGDFSHRFDHPTAVNSIIVLDAFRRGLSEAQAQSAFTIATYERLGLLDAWQSSMAEMRLREANGVVTVPGADFMEEACRNYPAFLTMNHPSAPMLMEYLARVFRALDVRHQAVSLGRLQDPLALHDTTPVLDPIADYYQLPYRTSQRFKINALGQRHVSLEEYIARFYAAYREAGPAALVAHSPSDLVAALREDPARRFLADPAAPAPEAAAAAPEAATVDQRFIPLAPSVEEIKVLVHHVHSYLQVFDPKLESLSQIMPKLDRMEAAIARLPPAPSPRAPGRRASVLASAVAVLVLVAGLVAARFL